MWVYITSLAATALALLELAKDWREYKTNNRRVTVLSLIIVAGIGGSLATYFSDRAAERQHSEDQARIVELQTTLDAEGTKLDKVVLLLQAQVEQPTPFSPPVVNLSWERSATGKTFKATTVGYCVYRSSLPHDQKTGLNAVPITTTSYVDSTVVPGRTYYYSVRSISASAVLSAGSNDVVKSVPVYDGYIAAPSRYTPPAPTSSLTQLLTIETQPHVRMVCPQ